MRKNILIFGHSYGPQFIDINNQYTHLFDKDRFHVTVVYLIGEPSDEIANKHTADEVIFLNAPNNAIRNLKIAITKKMLRYCRDKQFEIVICHRYKPTYIMLWIAQFCKISALFFVFHELGAMKSVFRRLNIAALKKENMFFAGVSDAVRNDLRQHSWNVSPEKIITLHNMINVEATESQLLTRDIARQKLKLNLDDFIFGNVGRLAKNKDQKTLIQAFAAIESLCPNAKLVIAGDGKLEHELKAQVSQLGLTHKIIFTDYLVDAFTYMKAFDVFVLSSIQEAFGLVLLEAMIAKLPIIATEVNGIPEVVGDIGHIIPPAHVDELAAQMRKLFEAPRETLLQKGDAGYQRANTHFSIQHFKKIFWEIPHLSHLKENT